jgi:ATP-dependent protease ClpP protease subunit
VIGHIYIYGEVGKQVTLDTVLKEITPKATEYEVHIHSPGGEVFEGYAIYNAIKNTGKNITVKIEGVCASIATLIAAAGSKIIMNSKAQFMIHNPRVQIGGEAKDLRNAAGQLDKIKSQLISSWVGRTTLTEAQLSEMYDHETWLTPEQAKEMGFVDEVQEVLRAAASANIQRIRADGSFIINQSTFKVGDKVTAKEDSLHDPSHKGMVMTVAEISTPALALKMEDGTIHKWYVDQELEPINDTRMENTEKLSAIESLLKKVVNYFTPKNMTETLSDGRVINVPDEDDWTGKPVTLEDGSPLEDGTFTIAGGKSITVAGGNITEVKEAEAAVKEEEKPEDMETVKKLEAAEARIKELESALTAQTEAKTQAEAKAKKFENKATVEVKALQEELLKIKNTTVGDPTPPKKAEMPNFGQPVTLDPMQQFFKTRVLDTRNTD